MYTLPSKNPIHMASNQGLYDKAYFNRHFGFLGVDLNLFKSTKTFDYTKKPNENIPISYSEVHRNKTFKEQNESQIVNQALGNLHLEKLRIAEKCMPEKMKLYENSASNKSKMTEKSHEPRAAKAKQCPQQSKGKSKKHKKSRKREKKNKRTNQKNKPWHKVSLEMKVEEDLGNGRYQSPLQFCAITIPSPIIIATDTVDGCYSPKQRNIRSRLPSECGSEDSFIIFSDISQHKTDCDSLPSAELGGKINISISITQPYVQSRTRLPSECGSEDSFIIFDDASRSICQEPIVYDFSDNDSDDDSHYNGIHEKKVRFASEENLCEIHPMIQWSYAYQKARKGPWEQYALDRVRFQSRVLKAQSVLDPVLKSAHRNQIYKERFQEID